MLLPPFLRPRWQCRHRCGHRCQVRRRRQASARHGGSPSPTPMRAERRKHRRPSACPGKSLSLNCKRAKHRRQAAARHVRQRRLRPFLSARLARPPWPPPRRSVWHRPPPRPERSDLPVWELRRRWHFRKRPSSCRLQLKPSARRFPQLRKWRRPWKTKKKTTTKVVAL